MVEIHLYLSLQWESVYDDPEHSKSKDITDLIKVLVSQQSYYKYIYSNLTLSWSIYFLSAEYHNVQTCSSLSIPYDYTS